MKEKLVHYFCSGGSNFLVSDWVCFSLSCKMITSHKDKLVSCLGFWKKSQNIDCYQLHRISNFILVRGAFAFGANF